MAGNMTGHSENGHYEDGSYESRGFEFRGGYPGQSTSHQETTGWMQQSDKRQDGRGGYAEQDVVDMVQSYPSSPPQYESSTPFSRADSEVRIAVLADYDTSPDSWFNRRRAGDQQGPFIDLSILQLHTFMISISC